MKVTFLVVVGFLAGAAPNAEALKFGADPLSTLSSQVKALKAEALKARAADPLSTLSSQVRHARESEKGATIKSVVTMLQGMLDKSKTEGDKERGLYAKYKCYVDTQTTDKKKNIDKQTTTIALLEAKIEELGGNNGQLSQDVAQLKFDMDDNKEMQKKAQKIRDDEKKAFDDEKKDLDAAIASLGSAIDTLAAVGADQDMADDEANAAHDQYMAGYEMPSALLKVKTEVKQHLMKVNMQVKQALLAAKAFVKTGDVFAEKIEAFLQISGVPGAYMAQSGEVVGILKNMKMTFETNLEEAKETEKEALKTHTKFDKTKKEEWTTMDKSYTAKTGIMAGNDGELSTKQGEYETAKTQVADDTEFLEKLEPLASDKLKEYEERKLWRSNEDMAIAQAIAILDNDIAADKFGKVKATSTGPTGFLQLSAVHTLSLEEQEEVSRRSASRLLQETAHSMHSRRLAGIVALLNRKNPFTTVLTAISDLKKTIDDEAKVDKAQNDWCKEERKTVKADLKTKKAQLVTLGTDITKLDDTIDGATTGLKALIKKSEDDIKTNGESQSSETKTRREENLLYQTETLECAAAQVILQKAIKLLEKYYDDVAPGQVFTQEDPTPPATWTGDRKDQSTKGAEVIKMLKFVHDNTGKEISNLAVKEATAQQKYEDSMQLLTDDETDLKDDLAKSKKSLADSELDLDGKYEDQDRTEQDQLAIEHYLETIKPGCDFVVDGFSDRETSRGKEKTALTTAITKLKGTPAFASAKIEDQHEEWGDCKETCIASEADAKCQSCLTGTSVPGYCVTHPSTPGC